MMEMLSNAYDQSPANYSDSIGSNNSSLYSPLSNASDMNKMVIDEDISFVSSHPVMSSEIINSVSYAAVNESTLVPTCSPTISTVINNVTIIEMVEVLKNSTTSGNLTQQELAVDKLLDVGFVFSNSFYEPPGFSGLLLVLCVSLLFFIPSCFFTLLFFVQTNVDSKSSEESPSAAFQGNESTPSKNKEEPSRIQKVLSVGKVAISVAFDVILRVKNLNNDYTSRDNDIWTIGPDATLYLALQAELLRFLLLLCSIALCLLLPIHISFSSWKSQMKISGNEAEDVEFIDSNMKTVDKMQEKMDSLATVSKDNNDYIHFMQTTIQSLPKRTTALWTHVLLSYIVTFLFLLFIRRCRHVCEWLRMRTSELGRAKNAIRHRKYSQDSPQIHAPNDLSNSISSEPSSMTLSSPRLQNKMNSKLSIKSSWEATSFIQGGIPPEVSTEEMLFNLLNTVYPGQIRRVLMIYDVSSIQSIQRKRTKAELKLEELNKEMEDLQMKLKSKIKGSQENLASQLETTALTSTPKLSIIEKQSSRELTYRKPGTYAIQSPISEFQTQTPRDDIEDVSALFHNDSYMSSTSDDENDRSGLNRENSNTPRKSLKLHTFLWTSFRNSICYQCVIKLCPRYLSYLLSYLRQNAGYSRVRKSDQAGFDEYFDNDDDEDDEYGEHRQSNTERIEEEEARIAAITKIQANIQKLTIKIENLREEEAELIGKPRLSSGRALIFFQSPVQALDFVSKERRATATVAPLSRFARVRPQNFPSHEKYLESLSDNVLKLHTANDQEVANDPDEMELTLYLSRTVNAIESIPEWDVIPGPNPDDIIWESFHLNPSLFRVRYLTVNVAIILFLFMITTPTQILAIISSAASPETRASFRSSYSLFVANLREISPSLGDFLFGFLPQLFLVFCDVILLFIINHVAKHWEPHETRSERESSILRKSFIFLLLNTLVLPSLALNSVASFVGHLLKNETGSLAMLKKSFVTTSGMSTLSLLIVQTFVGGSSDLIRVSDWLDRIFRGYFIFRPWATAIERYKARTEQFEMDYGTEYAVLVTFFTLCIVFFLEIPLILPFGVLYLFVKSVIDRFAIYHQCKRFGFERASNIIAGNSAVSLIWVTLILFQVSLLGFFITDVCGPVLEEELKGVVENNKNDADKDEGTAEPLNKDVLRPCIDANLNPGSLLERGTSIQIYLISFLLISTCVCAFVSIVLGFENRLLDLLRVPHLGSNFKNLSTPILPLQTPRKIEKLQPESQIQSETQSPIESEPHSPTESEEQKSNDIEIEKIEMPSPIPIEPEIKSEEIKPPALPNSKSKLALHAKASRILQQLATKKFLDRDNKVGQPFWKDRVFIGAAGSALNREELKMHDISYIVCLCPKKMPNNNPCPFGEEFNMNEKEIKTIDTSEEKINYLVIDIKDRIGEKLGLHIDKILEFIDYAVDHTDKNVLIHCWKGKSRSAAVSVAFLMKREKCNAMDALEIVRKSRPIAQPNVSFFLFLRSLESESNV